MGQEVGFVEAGPNDGAEGAGVAGVAGDAGGA